MEVAVGILVVIALGYGGMKLLQVRARKASEKQARAAKRAKSAQADARALQRTLDGRR